MIPVDPRGRTLFDWTDSMQPVLATFGVIPILLDETKWQEWANQIIQLPTISGMNPPIPREFSDWREWATRFNQTLES